MEINANVNTPIHHRDYGRRQNGLFGPFGRRSNATAAIAADKSACTKRHTRTHTDEITTTTTTK